ncbi:MAG TPA: hypothetical protein VF747_12605 [Blastocatellia bacterium]|jgi:hypothetical protein
MSEMYVMRRANGDLFAEEIDGKLKIPIWVGLEAVARYRERNPELMTFLPAPLSRPLMQKIQSGLGREGAKEFFLLSEDAPDAYLDNGRPISLEEIFQEGEITSRPAQFQV